MRILLMNEYGSWGGAEKIFFYVARELQHSGHELLCLLGAEGTLSSKLREVDIPVEYYGKSRRELKENSLIIMGKRIPNILAMWHNSQQLKRDAHTVASRIQAFKPHLIYLNNLRPLVIYNHMPIPRKCKVIWHEHGYQRSRIRQYVLDNRLLKKVDRVICVSKHVYDCHEKGVQKKAVILNNGIEDIYKQVESQHQETIFIQPAFITRWKGQHTVLEAVNLLVHKYKRKDFRVEMAGKPRSQDDTRYYRGLQKYVEEHKLSGYVTFLGYRSDIIDLIGQSDILISSSADHDPFPTILLEGCCLGKPILASNAGGSSDIVSHQENGFIYPMGDAHKLAWYMLYMLEHPDQRQTQGVRSRERYEKLFTIQGFNERIYQVIDHLR